MTTHCTATCGRNGGKAPRILHPGWPPEPGRNTVVRIRCVYLEAGSVTFLLSVVDHQLGHTFAVLKTSNPRASAVQSHDRHQRVDWAIIRRGTGRIVFGNEGRPTSNSRPGVRLQKNGPLDNRDSTLGGRCSILFRSLYRFIIIAIIIIRIISVFRAWRLPTQYD